MTKIVRYTWALPYSVAKSLPYFFKDIWEALDNFYNNVTCELMFLVKDD